VFKCYPYLSARQKDAIVGLKQQYFFDNVKNTQPNTDVLNILNAQSTEYCILWTSAEKGRVQALLNHYNIINKFKEILYSEKNDIVQDIDSICKLFDCKPHNLMFYEDNLSVVDQILNLRLNVMSI